MNRLKIFTYSLAAVLLASSCQKELSVEDNGNPGTGNGGNPPLGANCRVAQIISTDSATGVGQFSLYTIFNANGIATKVEAFDSTASQMQFESTLQYTGDTIRVSPVEYFLTDAYKKIRAFHTYENPSDTSTQKLVYDYEYDANAYLTGKNVSLESIPVPIVTFRYTWSGGNLISVDGSIPVLSQKVITAELEYDLSKTAKNFIPIFPDGYEFAPFILAFDLGQKNKNVVNKITVHLYDENGNLTNTYVTSFKDFVFSSDGYLLEWFAQGDSQGGLAMGNGRTKFKYFCR